MEETPGTIPPRYNEDQAYKRAFGHSRPPYPTLLQQGRTIGLGISAKLKALKGSFKLQSQLGTEYALPTILDGWQVPGEPIIAINGGKNVIETKLNRGQRTQNVIEEVNLNNYKIKLRGIIINKEFEDQYPEVEVRRLREILEKPGSVSIENGLTALWNISNVVIVDWDIFEVEGDISAQAFQIDMISDRDLELEIIDDPERI
jgi:hypothetical protein